MSLMSSSLEPPADTSESGALAARLGIEVIGVAADGPLLLAAALPVAGNTQPFGLLHGGASAALAEHAASIAAIRAHPGRTVFGVDLSITHLTPARTGRVVAYVSALTRGGHDVTYRVEIRQEDTDPLTPSGELRALAHLRCAIR